MYLVIATATILVVSGGFYDRERRAWISVKKISLTGPAGYSNQ
jgi:hypothetical protein